MSLEPSACMVLAAGFGTRMGALTKTRPKPMIEVAGKPLLDHALDRAHQGGAERIVVNTHYLADQIISHLEDRSGVTVLHETPEILDSGGGVFNALPHLGQAPFWVMNSDNVWSGPNPLQQLAQAWDPALMDGLMLLVPLSRTIGRDHADGLSMSQSGALEFASSDLVYTGAQILSPAVFNACSGGAFPIRPLWEDLARQGRLHGILYDGHWADVGQPSGIALAEAMLERAEP